MNKLVVLSGVPGSGKSYFSLLLKEKKKDGHLYIVSSDALRTKIGGSQTNFNNEDLMWEMYYELASVYSLDKNGIVILDSTNAKDEYRVDKTSHLKGLFDEVDLVIFKLDKITVMRQNLDREYPIPTTDLERLINTFQTPTEKDEKYFDHIYKIESDDLSKVINEIVS